MNELIYGKKAKEKKFPTSWYGKFNAQTFPHWLTGIFAGMDIIAKAFRI